MKTANRKGRSKNKLVTVKRKGKVAELSNLPDLSSDPYVLKKAEDAREFLIKYVAPTISKPE
jgi:hypothetical protein